MYFGAGKYAPQTRAGQHLLAHELAHVAQQTSGLPGAAGLVQPKLDLHDTRWQTVRRIKSSDTGAVGVVIIWDDTLDPPLILKTGEARPADSLLTREVLALLGGPGGPGWSVSSPEVRPVGEAEAQVIAAKLRTLLPEGDDRADRILDDLQKPGVVLFDYAPGEDLSASTQDQREGPVLKHTRKRSRFARGGANRTFREGSGWSLFQDPAFVNTLGRAAAFDIFVGNFDRSVGKWNLENFRIDRDRRQMSLIDNVERAGWSVFEQWVDSRGTFTGRDAVALWSRRTEVVLLRARKYGTLAEDTLNKLQTYAQSEVRRQDYPLLKQTLDNAKPAFSQGLAQGLELLLNTLPGRTGQVLDQVSQQLPTARRDIMEESITERLRFLAERPDRIMQIPEAALRRR